MSAAFLCVCVCVRACVSKNLGMFENVLECFGMSQDVPSTSVSRRSMPGKLRGPHFLWTEWAISGGCFFLLNSRAVCHITRTPRYSEALTWTLKGRDADICLLNQKLVVSKCVALEHVPWILWTLFFFTRKQYARRDLASQFAQMWSA